MRLAILLLCALGFELGWLAMWPLSVALSHSPLFTAALVDSHPVIGAVLQTTARLEPGVAEATLTDPLGSAAYLAPASWLGCLLLGLLAVYGAAVLLLDRGLGARRAATATVIGGAVVFQITLLGLPGFFSQDVFGYIAYGRIAAVYDLNPYVWPPSVLRDPVVAWVADVWRTYAAPYGPLWVDLQWVLARVSDRLSIADQALLYRGLASVLLLANVVLAWRLLGRMRLLGPAQRTATLAALAWNPLLLFEVAGNAHNDILMVSFCLLGLLLFTTSSRGRAACVALTLGALVKYLSGVGLLWVALASAARMRTWPRRLRRITLLAAASLGITLVLTAPWLELPDSLDPLLNETAGVGYVNSLPDTLVLMAVDRTGASLDAARGLERALALAIFATYLVWEARQVLTHADREAVTRGLARACLVYVLVASTSVQTWYFCLPLSIALLLGWRNRVARLALAYSGLALPALYLSYYLRESTPSWVFFAYGFLPLLVLLPDVVRSRVRAPVRIAPAAEQPRGAAPVREKAPAS